MSVRRLLILVSVLLMLAPAAQAEFSWQIDESGALAPFFDLQSFHTTVTNTGATPDTVHVNMVKEMPAEWVGSLCEEELCYPPFLLDIDLELAPGQSIELLIDITPTTVLGTGSSLITLSSSQSPQVEQQTFTVVTPGADVLLIDATPGGAAGDLIGPALAAGGKTVGVWTIADLGKAAPADLAQFPAVVWTAGGLANGMDMQDMTDLQSYVTAGGHLLLSGQNLLFGFADPISPYYDPAAVAWFRDVMGADYVSNIGSTDLVTPVVDDPIFGGLSYALNGGDGTNDNVSPDVMAPWPGGRASLDYGGGGQAAVWSISGNGKTLLAGFGIESLPTTSQRADFVARVLAWFDAGYSNVPDETPSLIAGRALAAPNPFNPRTEIRFVVGGETARSAVVTVHDARGRTVRRLLAGDVTPGPQRLAWDGRDDGGRSVAAGLYMARIQVGGDEQIVKLALVK